MALQPTRYEYRLTLSHVDRGLEAAETLVAARHPSETQRHLTLRVLAWCLLHEEGLQFGPGLSTPDSADLWTHDLTGRLTNWIECGAIAGERLRKSLLRHSGAASHVVTDDAEAARVLLEELAVKSWPRGTPAPVIWTIDHALVAELAAKEERRQRWSVTVVGDHFYLDADGKALDGPVTQQTLQT
jgi:uncharacterized protein YaeQ